MKILSLEVTNFKRLSGKREYTFDDGITSIVGSNGRGKSTIANAIAWVLYGPAALESNKEDVITWGEKSCLVQLTFEIDNQIYVIRRSQKSNGTSNAELNRDKWNGDVVAMGIDPTNREVERLLGVDRVGFLVSVYSQQEELDGLVSLTPANRKKVVLRLLGIERLTSAIEEVRSDARHARAVLDGLLAGQSESIEDIDSRIATLREQRNEMESDMWALHNEEHEQQEHHDALLAQQQALTPKRIAYEKFSLARASEEAILNTHKNALATAEREAKDAAANVKQGPEPEAVEQSQLEILSELGGRTRLKIQQAEEQINSSFCRACKRPFENVEEQAAHARSECDDLKAELQVIQEEYNEVSAKLLAYGEWHRAHAAYEEAVGRAETARKAVAAAQGRLDALAPAEDVQSASEALHAQVLESAAAAARIQRDLSTLAERVRQSKAEEKTLLARRKSMSEALEKIGEAQRETLYNETTATLLGKLKDSLISDIVPNLASRASTLVSEFTDGKYTELSLTPDYEVQFRNYLGDLKAFSNLSGGEKDIFALSLRLAIADLRAERVGLLILDEVIESMDPERQESTWQTIERLSTRYDQILFITHAGGFRDRATQVITV